MVRIPHSDYSYSGLASLPNRPFHTFPTRNLSQALASVYDRCRFRLLDRPAIVLWVYVAVTKTSHVPREPCDSMRFNASQICKNKDFGSDASVIFGDAVFDEDLFAKVLEFFLTNRYLPAFRRGSHQLSTIKAE